MRHTNCLFYFIILIAIVCGLKQKQPKADVITEEMMEQRQQELEEKFPERKEMDLDAPWQLELSKLQRKVK